MSNQLYDKISRAEGYCCPLAFTIAARRLRAKSLAAHLGVSKWTINFWRGRLKRRELMCCGRKDCQYAVPRDYSLPNKASTSR